MNFHIEQVQKINKENCLIINEKSSSKEVANFLKTKFNVPEKIIDEMELDGEYLLLLSEANIDEIEDLPEETKKCLKNFLNEKKRKETNSNLIEKETKKANDEYCEFEIGEISTTSKRITHDGELINIDNNDNELNN